MIGYNAYAGAYQNYNIVYGGDYLHGSNKDTLYMGDFKFFRHKLTNPELITITGVVPTTNTPQAFLNGANVNIGDRIGVGVSNTPVRTVT